MSALEELKKITKVVADTGDYEQLKEYGPVDATTNPSLILQAAKQEKFDKLVRSAVERAKGRSGGNCKEDLVDRACDELLVSFGAEILKVIPGRVSIEVDASLSFDKEAMVQKARTLVDAFKSIGIQKNRLLIKLAATWEGCEAARDLQKEGIDCNVTLMFCMAQAMAAAEAGAYLISPFVGRILDWHKLHSQGNEKDAEDPGVKSVKEIYAYYKTHNYKTVVMGASFRNVDEILSLAGCDNLTIAPKFLKELSDLPADKIRNRLDSEFLKIAIPPPKVSPLTQSAFRWMLNQDQMATDKLSEGIRNFHNDWLKLKSYIRATYL